MPGGQFGEQPDVLPLQLDRAADARVQPGPLGRPGQRQVRREHVAQVSLRQHGRQAQQPVVDPEREHAIVDADKFGQEVRREPGQRQVEAAVPGGQRAGLCRVEEVGRGDFRQENAVVLKLAPTQVMQRTLRVRFAPQREVVHEEPVDDHRRLGGWLRKHVEPAPGQQPERSPLPQYGVIPVGVDAGQ